MYLNLQMPVSLVMLLGLEMWWSLEMLGSLKMLVFPYLDLHLLPLLSMMLKIRLLAK
jgi:hypothetical protein